MTTSTSHSMQALRAIYPQAYDLWSNTTGLSFEQALKRTNEHPSACVICIKPLKTGQVNYCSPACVNEADRRINEAQQASNEATKARWAEEEAAAVAAKQGATK